MAKVPHLDAFEFPQGPKNRGGSKLRLMARSGGYVMVRHPHCIPFCLTDKEWASLPDWE